MIWCFFSRSRIIPNSDKSNWCIYSKERIYHSYDGILLLLQQLGQRLSCYYWELLYELMINISEMWVLSLQSPCTMIYCSKVMNIGIFSPISSLLPQNDHAEIYGMHRTMCSRVGFLKFLSLIMKQNCMIGPQSSSDSEETISATLITLWTKYKHNMLKN